MKKTLIIMLATLSLPIAVMAKEDWSVDEKVNTIVVNGDCHGAAIRVDLYYGGSNDPVYTSGARCENGKFSFSDNLLQWKSLADGSYDVVIDNNRSGSKTVKIERPAEVSSVADASTAKKEDADAEKNTTEPVAQETTFLDSFTKMQQSILDMRTQLEFTDYSEMVKISLGTVLDTLDAASGKLADVMFSSPNAIGEETSITPEEKIAEPEDDDGKSNDVPVEEVSDTDQNGENSEQSAADVSINDNSSQEIINQEDGKDISSAVESTQKTEEESGLRVDGVTGATE